MERLEDPTPPLSGRLLELEVAYLPPPKKVIAYDAYMGMEADALRPARLGDALFAGITPGAVNYARYAAWNGGGVGRAKEGEPCGGAPLHPPYRCALWPSMPCALSGHSRAPLSPAQV